MEVRAFYIIGFPYETTEQMMETIDFAKKQILIDLPLMPYFGA